MTSLPAMDKPQQQPSATPIDRRRYRQVRWFFAKAFLHIFWHDFVLRWRPFRWLRSEPIPRWTNIARRFRAVAVELGGVLIKLGQYLSARVDLLPLEVTRELSGLQDEVPPVEFAAIARQLEEDFDLPLAEIFREIEPEPLGAASLAQVHRAQLPDGQAVVAKVLRPGIEVLVETDLKAIGLAVRWLKWWGFVRRRIDLDWVEEEFSTTTRQELDLQAEGRSVERFTELFADDPEVYLPKVYWDRTATRTLTEENVSFIKIFDLPAMEAEGIEPEAVARQLYRVYMRQIFIHHAVHADPHPGNLFVKPVEKTEGHRTGFQIVFVDFGMVAEIPPRLRAALRLFLIGLGNRDSSMVIQSLRDGGYLLPGADLFQLEEAVDAIFERFWGVEVGRLTSLVMSEAAPLWKEFGRLLLETPIQLQVDLMFTGRAVELLSGLTTGLDEGFNPWTEVVPFAEILAAEAAEKGWAARGTELLDQFRRLALLPGDVGRVANLAQRGRLTIRSSLAPDSRKQLERLEGSVDRLNATLAVAAVLVSGALLYGPNPLLGGLLMGGAGLWFVGSRLFR